MGLHDYSSLAGLGIMKYPGGFLEFAPAGELPEVLQGNITINASP
jgi:hypothetical protein